MPARIWGVRSGLIGDTIMTLPALTYLEKKYPDSFKYWVIDKKCSQAAPVYLNHPLINQIKITDKWLGLGENDQKIIDTCNVVFELNPQPTQPAWWNVMDCVDQALLMAGLHDYKEVLTAEELVPKLYKWFPDPSNTTKDNHAYTFNDVKPPKKPFSVGIMPFAHYGGEPRRSPTKEWWDAVCSKLDGYDIKHFGWITEPDIVNTTKFTTVSYFEQIKMALECDIVLGTDSGSMWILGAYEHPTVAIMTYHMPGHRDNPNALFPKNKNGIMLFDPNGCNMVHPDRVVERVKAHEENTSD